MCRLSPCVPAGAVCGTDVSVSMEPSLPAVSLAALGVTGQQPLHGPRHEGAACASFCRCYTFSLSHLDLIHFEFIFVDGVTQGPNFSLFPVTSRGPSTMC